MFREVIDLICMEFNIKDRQRLIDIITPIQGLKFASLSDIAAELCKLEDISIEELKSKSPKSVYIDGKRRLEHYVELRSKFAKIANAQYGYGPVAIARFLQCDHTTVVHYLRYRKERVDPLTINEGYQAKKSFERIKGEYTNIQSNYLNRAI